MKPQVVTPTKMRQCIGRASCISSPCRGRVTRRAPCVAGRVYVRKLVSVIGFVLRIGSLINRKAPTNGARGMTIAPGVPARTTAGLTHLSEHLRDVRWLDGTL